MNKNEFRKKEGAMWLNAGIASVMSGGNQTIFDKLMFGNEKMKQLGDDNG